MKESALNVFAAGVRAGRLNRSELEEETILFAYRARCPPEAAVSLTMPVRSDQYDAMGGLLPLFEMNLPEGVLKEALHNQFAKVIPEFDDLDMLSIVGSSQIGRLRYSPHAQLQEDVPEQSLREILRYEGTLDLFTYLLQRFSPYSGISGVQPKVLVRDADLERVTHRGATHIVKAFDADRYPELAANEYICTQGAAAAGVATAHMRLSENRRLLIVDRFDLAADGTYFGVEDFCVLEGRRSHGRYDGSYEGIARRILDFVSPERLDAALEQFALMVLYGCAVENGDAHLKNFSVLYENPEGQVGLAPAYDMLSTTVYLPRDTLALTLGGSKRFPDRVQLLQFVRHVTGKTEQGAAELLERAATGVTAAMNAARQYAAQYPDAERFAARLCSVMARGLDRSFKSPTATVNVKGTRRPRSRR